MHFARELRDPDSTWTTARPTQAAIQFKTAEFGRARWRTGSISARER